MHRQVTDEHWRQTSDGSNAHDPQACAATLTGLEPVTFRVTGERANQLRYRAIQGATTVVMTPSLPH